MNYDRCKRCILAGGAGLVVSVQALASTTFRGPGTLWFDDTNWTNNQIPDANTAAIIAAPCEIDEGREDAAALTVTIEEDMTLQALTSSILTLGDGDDGNESFIEDGAKLIIGTEGGPATLRIDGGHKITGNGGVIELWKSSNIDHESDDTDVLTLDHSCTPGDPAQNCSLVVTGKGNILVKTFNNAYVGAKKGDIVGFIVLAAHDKSGGTDGFWIAEGGGALDVYCNVTGAGKWHAKDTTFGGTIYIGEDDGSPGCVSAEGDVILKANGLTLVVRTDSQFCTTGNLTFESTAENTGPEILTAANAWAQFGASCSLTGCQ